MEVIFSEGYMHAQSADFLDSYLFLYDGEMPTQQSELPFGAGEDVAGQGFQLSLFHKARMSMRLTDLRSYYNKTTDKGYIIGVPTVPLVPANLCSVNVPKKEYYQGYMIQHPDTVRQEEADHSVYPTLNPACFTLHKTVSFDINRFYTQYASASFGDAAKDMTLYTYMEYEEDTTISTIFFKRSTNFRNYGQYSYLYVTKATIEYYDEESESWIAQTLTGPTNRLVSAGRYSGWDYLDIDAKVESRFNFGPITAKKFRVKTESLYTATTSTYFAWSNTIHVLLANQLDVDTNSGSISKFYPTWGILVPATVRNAIYDYSVTADYRAMVVSVGGINSGANINLEQEGYNYNDPVNIFAISIPFGRLDNVSE